MMADTLTVGELVEHLSQWPDDSPVVLATPVEVRNAKGTRIPTTEWNAVGIGTGFLAKNYPMLTVGQKLD